MRFPGWLAGSCEIGAECSRAVRVCARAAGFLAVTFGHGSIHAENESSKCCVGGKKKNNSDT